MRRFNISVNGVSYDVCAEEAGAGAPAPVPAAAPVAAAPVAAAVGLGAAGYGVAKSIKNKRKLEEENRRLREELAKK